MKSLSKKNSNTILNRSDIQLNGLIDIIQAINSNLPDENLLRVYKFTVLSGLEIKKIALFTVKENNYLCQINFGSQQSLEGITLPTYLTSDPINTKWLEDEILTEFEEYITIHHHKKLLGVVFYTATNKSQSNLLNALTDVVLVAIENKKMLQKEQEQKEMQRQMELAMRVQQFLFPKSLPDNNHMQLKAFYQPHDLIGGDYYDYVKIDSTRSMICVADVSGKGIPAALLMSNFQASIRALLYKTQDLKEVVCELNQIIFERSQGDNFITLFIALYDQQHHVLEYINAGHNEVFFKSDTQTLWLDRGTAILGALPTLPHIETTQISPQGKFLLVAYTDGITDTINEDGEFYGIDRLENLLSCNMQATLEIQHQMIVKDLEKFKGKMKFTDDITILSFRCFTP